MGREARCLVRLGDTEATGKALLETDELLFRGDFRLAIRFADITSLQAADGVLSVGFDDRTAHFQLGAEAEKWRERILNPPTLLDKLGIKPEMRVAVQGITDPDFLAQLHRACAAVLRDRPANEADLLLIQVDTPPDLHRVGGLEPQIRRSGGIWIAHPRGCKELSEGHVLEAGRRAGLVDVKVCRFSGTHTAHKFVIPRERR